MRLIDADALIEKTSRLLFFDVNDRIVVDTFIENALTVNIEPEVAREIFAEIEKHIQAKINSIPIDEWEDDFFTGERSALVNLAHDIAELKNKYIGGEGE